MIATHVQSDDHAQRAGLSTLLVYCVLRKCKNESVLLPRSLQFLTITTYARYVFPSLDLMPYVCNLKYDYQIQTKFESSPQSRKDDLYAARLLSYSTVCSACICRFFSLPNKTGVASGAGLSRAASVGARFFVF